MNAAPFVAFGVSIAFWPGLAGAATSPRWAIAALSLWAMEWYCLPFVALCFCVLSFDAAVHWAIVSAAFSWGIRLARTKTLGLGNAGCRSLSDGRSAFDRVILWTSWGVAVSGIAVIAQVLGWTGVDQAVAPAGLFVNKNLLGEAACLALIATLTFKPSGPKWAANINITLISTAIVLTQSRSVWCGTLMGLFLLSSSRLRYWGLVTLPFLALSVWWLGYLDGETLSQRFAFWYEAVPRLALFGNGSYDELFNFGRATQLHNDWLQLVYELGLFGLIPLAVVLAACWNSQAVPFVAALLIIGFFGFPLQMPATAWFAAFVIGHSLGVSDIKRRVVLFARSVCDEPPATIGIFENRS